MPGERHTTTGSGKSRERSARRRLRTRQGSSIAVNLAPMIDVSFLLLIFFLVTTTFERAEGLLASKMPKDSGGPAAALPLTPILVRLSPVVDDADGVEIFVKTISRRAGGFDELAGMLAELQLQPGFDKDTPVVIVAGDKVRWDHVVNAWNAALRAGCAQVAFGEQ